MKCCGPRNAGAVQPYDRGEEGAREGSCAWWCEQAARDSILDPDSSLNAFCSGSAWGLPYAFAAAALGAGDWSGAVWCVACLGNALLSGWNIDQKNAQWNLDDERSPRVIKTNPWVLVYCSEPCAVYVCFKKNCCNPPSYDNIGGGGREMR